MHNGKCIIHNRKCISANKPLRMHLKIVLCLIGTSKACVCLEKGGFSDFSKLPSYRIFSNLSMFLLSMVYTILPSKFLFEQSWASKDITQNWLSLSKCRQKRVWLPPENFKHSSGVHAFTGDFLRNFNYGKGVFSNHLN